MNPAKLYGLSVLVVLFVGGFAGCDDAVERGDPPVDEVSQELARCGPNGTCGAGFTCRFQDGACHPNCVFFPESVSSLQGSVISATGSCPAPFNSWQCCSGGYCAVSCP